MSGVYHIVIFCSFVGSMAMIVSGGPATPAMGFTVYNICHRYTVFDARGHIVSPNYPLHTSYEQRGTQHGDQAAVSEDGEDATFCGQVIRGNADDRITISFDDMALSRDQDLPETGCTQGSQCCSDSDHIGWIKITEPHGYTGFNGVEHSRWTIYCGSTQSPLPPPYISTSSTLHIKYKMPKNTKARFMLTYRVGRTNDVCYADEHRCVANGNCIPIQWVCNGLKECADDSDEQPCVCGNEFGDGNLESGTSGGDLRHHLYRCPDSSQMCIPMGKVCDGRKDCPAGGDETNCLAKQRFEQLLRQREQDRSAENIPFLTRSECRFRNQTLCSLRGSECFVSHQRCNGGSYYRGFCGCSELDCPGGEDELSCISGCGDKIMCGSRETCYMLHQRCDGINDCIDKSDEARCPSWLCSSSRGGYRCDGDSRCVPESARCDRIADCADGSDEYYCLQNSLITAAIMGSLVCGLLVVIALSCTCRLYAMRCQQRYQRQHDECPIVSSESGTGGEQSSTSNATAVTLPAVNSSSMLFDLESMAAADIYCLYREPPPPYSVAVGQIPHHMSEVDAVRSSSSRRNRASRRSTQQQHRPRHAPPPSMLSPLPAAAALLPPPPPLISLSTSSSSSANTSRSFHSSSPLSSAKRRDTSSSTARPLADSTLTSSGGGIAYCRGDAGIPMIAVGSGAAATSSSSSNAHADDDVDTINIHHEVSDASVAHIEGAASSSRPLTTVGNHDNEENPV